MSNFCWEKIILQYIKLWTEQKEVSHTLKKINHINRFSNYDRFYNYTSMNISNIEAVKLDMDCYTSIIRNNNILLHFQISDIIDLNIIDKIINMLFKNNYLKPSFIADTLKDLEIEEENIMFHLLWLMKYGILKICYK